MRVLLHICCAPCAIVPLERLRGLGHSVTAFSYNPNVQPYTENRRRLEQVEQFCAQNNVELIKREQYDVTPWIRRALDSPIGRCAACYADRLNAAAAQAAELGLDAFTATLFYSKYQDHELMARIAREAAEQHDIEFLYIDFSDGWSEGIKRSKEQGMYRQQYCGCIFSEQERYLNAKSKKKSGQPEKKCC